MVTGGGMVGVRLFYGSIVGGWGFSMVASVSKSAGMSQGSPPSSPSQGWPGFQETVNNFVDNEIICCWNHSPMSHYCHCCLFKMSQFSGEKKTNFSGRNKWHWCENWAVYLYPAQTPMASYGWLAGQRYPLYTLMMMSAIGMKDQGCRELQHTVGRPLAGLPARPLTLLLACLVLGCLSGIVEAGATLGRRPSWNLIVKPFANLWIFHHWFEIPCTQDQNFKAINEVDLKFNITSIKGWKSES